MGKYDSQVNQVYNMYDVLKAPVPYSLDEYNTLAFNNLFRVIKLYRGRFINRKVVLKYFDAIENSNDPMVALNTIRSRIETDIISDDDLVDILFNSANMILAMICDITSQKPDTIIHDLRSLYTMKNDDYGDTWHKRGSYGIYTELERKVFRFHRIIAEQQIRTQKNESIEDTLKDTLNYITFFIICLKYVDSAMEVE